MTEIYYHCTVVCTYQSNYSNYTIFNNKIQQITEFLEKKCDILYRAIIKKIALFNCLSFMNSTY